MIHDEYNQLFNVQRSCHHYKVRSSEMTYSISLILLIGNSLKK